MFCRLLDKEKGGHFSIHPPEHLRGTTKQQYLPSSNILQTRYIHEEGVVDLVDFFPRPKNFKVVAKGPKQGAFREINEVSEELKQWLVRRVECIRGSLQLGECPGSRVGKRLSLTFNADVEIFPAFDYATAPHTTTILQAEGKTHGAESKTVTFHSKNLKLQLDVSIDKGENDCDNWPSVKFKKVSKPAMLGEGVVATIEICEGQAVSFVLREDKPDHVTQVIDSTVLDGQQHDTQAYWYNWISKSKYKGRWREVVNRSLMILKLMTYEPTGAIIASPTFSIPEDIGGVR